MSEKFKDRNAYKDDQQKRSAKTGRFQDAGEDCRCLEAGRLQNHQSRSTCG